MHKTAKRARVIMLGVDTFRHSAKVYLARSSMWAVEGSRGKCREMMSLV